MNTSTCTEDVTRVSPRFSGSVAQDTASVQQNDTCELAVGVSNVEQIQRVTPMIKISKRKETMVVSPTQSIDWESEKVDGDVSKASTPVLRTLLEEILEENVEIENKNKNKNNKNKNKNNKNTQQPQADKTGKPTRAANKREGPSYGDLKRQLDALMPLVDCQAKSLKVIEELVGMKVAPDSDNHTITVTEPSDSSEEESSSDEIII